MLVQQGTRVCEFPCLFWEASDNDFRGGFSIGSSSWPQYSMFPIISHLLKFSPFETYQLLEY
jgi:hypothetical protein